MFGNCKRRFVQRRFVQRESVNVGGVRKAIVVSPNICFTEHALTANNCSDIVGSGSGKQLFAWARNWAELAAGS